MVMHGLEGGVYYLDPLLAFAHRSDLIFLKSVSGLIPRREVPDVLLENGDFTPDRIRRYILHRTNNKIDVQVAPDSLKPDTILVVSTMVVQAEWQTLFYQQRTYQHPFQSLKEHGYLEAKVDMMTDVRIVPWKQDHQLGVTVAALPLKDKDLLFIIVLPLGSHGFADVEQAILKENDVLDTIFGGLEPTLVRLGIPRFRINTTFYMREGLQSLGMVQAFDPNLADFSKLSNATLMNDKLYLSDIVHAAAIEVNEEGVSPSSAASPIQLGHPFGMVPPDYSFIADHPFLFFIRHTVVGKTLLSGKYLGP
ncbi:unnamed protein product [Candidula unifasciata]|uniref:Serpin domain-containing protein n=1 Tax=Candidula unifasciata TaxID=100452 RepID=A0A8S3YL87_9EUPU|nr:unnamed protein product [Candidula unifasciata]